MNNVVVLSRLNGRTVHMCYEQAKSFLYSL